MTSTVLSQGEAKGSTWYVSFPWPPREVELSIYDVSFVLNKSGCCCVRHGRGFDVNTSALAANIFFGIWEWNENNEMDSWLLFSV